MYSFLFALLLRYVTLQCFFLAYKKVDYETNCFSLTPHLISTRIINSVLLSAIIGNIAFLEELDHRNSQLMLLSGVLLIATANTTILNKS